VLRCLLDADSFLRKRLHELVPDISPEDLESLLLHFAALHDLGKFAPAFQYQREDIAKRLDSPFLPSRNFAYHTQMGKALFFHEDYRDVWQSAFVCRDGWQHRDILEPLADAAFGHHGRPPHPPSDASLHIPAPTVAAIRQFLGEVGDHFLPGGLALPGDDDADGSLRPVSWLFAGLLVLADWIASGEGFPYIAEPMDSSRYWTEYALPQARAAVAACGVLPPLPSVASGFFELMPHLRGKGEATPLQEYAMDVAGRGSGPRLFLFEDVTGAGKTEAALLTAHALMAAGEAEGLYIGLPTTATANGMYARLADSYRALFAEKPDAPPSLMLAHGARGIHDAFLGSIGLERGVPSAADADASDGKPDERESGAFCAAWLADNRKKALLAPCGVGTLDQALLAVLPAKHQCLRLLGLGRSVLVADEVHAYDVYTSKLLETLLTFQAGLGSSAILLSATLPRALKQRFADAFCRGAGYPAQVLTEAPLPVATRIASDGFSETGLARTREIALDIETTGDAGRAFALLAAVHGAGGCAIFVCNTVDRAVAATEKLRALLPPDDVILFHARFAQCDRLAIEERALSLFGKDSTPEARRGNILVGTQVLEQSLDIDGDFIVTELAPMELLLQRFGRGHRHDRDWRPEGFATARACVLAPRAVDAPPPDWGEAELGKGLFVYPDRGLLWRTAKLLGAHPRIELPEHARELVEDAYNQEKFPTPEVFEASAQAREGKAWSEASLARANVLRFERGYGAEAADGRWHDDRVVPTRLGEPTETLRLLRVVGDGLELWAGPGRDAATCARSEVSVPAWRVADMELDAAWAERLAAFAATLPDKGRWVKFLPLAETPTPGVWRSALLGGEVTYSRVKGLGYSAT
jgi:CRISPR-associated endonuclease/helicase Cas3